MPGRVERLIHARHRGCASGALADALKQLYVKLIDANHGEEVPLKVFLQPAKLFCENERAWRDHIKEQQCDECGGLAGAMSGT
jgi:hypothetical protein